MLNIGRFVIIGEHESEPEGLIPIRLLSVSMKAQGWGWEPDTRAALDWLAERVEPGMTVADIGTGTGILALAAVALGAKEVTAYEQDEAVWEIAADNFRLNGYNASDIEFLRAYNDRQGFDLVVANLGDVNYSKILTAGVGVWTSAPVEPKWEAQEKDNIVPSLVDLPTDVGSGDIVRGVMRPHKVREWMLENAPDEEIATGVINLTDDQVRQVWKSGVARSMSQKPKTLERRGIVRRMMGRLHV